jgi:uncharacterized protein (TIGR02246 family)
MPTRQIMLTVALMACSLTSAIGAEVDRQAADEAAIHKAVEAYVAAFNRGDPKALAAMWSPEAVYSSPLSGVQVVGREEIEEHFAALFADFADEGKLEIAVSPESIQFISPGVAIEHGTSQLLLEGQPPEKSTYTAVYVKRDGQWLLDRVTEDDVVKPLSHYEHLSGLEWLVGRWTDQDEQATVVTDCHWARNNIFLVRSFAVEVRDRIDMAGIQIIGWDPNSKQVRSWVFDSDGGFGEGTWTNKGDRWYVRQSGVLADGSKTSAVNILTRLDDSTCTLQSVNRTIDGELLPNIEEVTITKEEIHHE